MTTKNSAGRPRLPGVVVWFGIVSLFTDVGTELIYPLLPMFLSDVLHARRGFIGAVEGAAEATAALLKLVSGRLADRAARKKPLVVFGYFLSSLVRPLVGLALAPWQVLATRVFDRVGKGVRSSPRDAILADSTPPGERGRAFGFHQAMDNAGAIFGPLAATGLLAAGLALRSILLLSAIPGALAMSALVFGVREPPPHPDHAKPAARGHIDGAAGATLARYLFAVTLFGLGNSSDAFLLLRAQQLGVAARYVPLLWGAHNATKAALSTWGGALSDRVGRRRVIVAGWALYAGTYVAFGFATQAWQTWALFIVYGVYYALTDGAQRAFVADLAPAGARGTAFGWYNAVVGIVALPASLGFGGLADRYGARVPFTVSALLAGAASAWLLLAVRPAAASTKPALPSSA